MAIHKIIFFLKDTYLDRSHRVYVIQLNRRTFRRKAHCTFSLKFSSRARKDLFIKTKAEKPSAEKQQMKRCSITIPLQTERGALRAVQAVSKTSQPALHSPTLPSAQHCQRDSSSLLLIRF